jgi:hypothetical protein
MTWKQSPASQKLLKLGKAALDHGLPRTNNTDVWLGAGLMLVDLMTSGHYPKNGASKAAAVAVRLADATIAKWSAPVHVDCKSGCAFCCRSLVSVTAPEAFLILDWLATKNAGEQVSIETNPAHCMFLQTGRCSVYHARPINCRRTFSGSARACEASALGAPGVAHLVMEPLQKGIYVRGLLLAAVAASGRAPHVYELESVVTTCAPDPRSEERWLAGDDPLHGVKHQAETGPIAAFIAEWRDRLSAHTGSPR